MTIFFIKNYALSLSLLHTILCVASLNALSLEDRLAQACNNHNLSTEQINALTEDIRDNFKNLGPKDKEKLYRIALIKNPNVEVARILLTTNYLTNAQANWKQEFYETKHVEYYFFATTSIPILTLLLDIIPNKNNNQAWFIQTRFERELQYEKRYNILSYLNQKGATVRLSEKAQKIMNGNSDYQPACRTQSEFNSYVEEVEKFCLFNLYQGIAEGNIDDFTELFNRTVSKMNHRLRSDILLDEKYLKNIRLCEKMSFAEKALIMSVKMDKPEIMTYLANTIQNGMESQNFKDAIHQWCKKSDNFSFTLKNLLNYAMDAKSTNAMQWLFNEENNLVTHKINAYDESCWQKAIKMKDPAIIQLCLNNGASITSDCIKISIPKSDETGNVEVVVSPLAYALHIKDESLSNFLIEKGATIGEREKEVAHKTDVQTLINLVTPKSVDIPKDSPENSPKENLNSQGIANTDGTKTQSIDQTPEAQQQGIRPTTAPSLPATQNFLKAAFVLGGVVSGVALIMYIMNALQKTSQENDSLSESETKHLKPAV